MAPRGFFEIGRRNLWGKNRAVNLFTRVSLRSRDIVLSEDGVRLEEPAAGSGYGFNEYRVVGTFREPRVFNTTADALLTGIIDQAIRSSFNFFRRQARAEVGLRLSQRYSVAGRYSYEHTRVVRRAIHGRGETAHRPRYFRRYGCRNSPGPSFVTHGATWSIPVKARSSSWTVRWRRAPWARRSGSSRRSCKASAYYRVPAERRVVVALGARLGLAHGLPRPVLRIGADGEPILDDSGRPSWTSCRTCRRANGFSPAATRRFADSPSIGWGPTRRSVPAAFQPAGTASSSSMPNCGAQSSGAWAWWVSWTPAMSFFVPAISDFTSCAQRRASALRYQSPIGPIRMDLGFKLDRRELAPGRLEKRSVLHISLGQAF